MGAGSVGKRKPDRFRCITRIRTTICNWRRGIIINKSWDVHLALFGNHCTHWLWVQSCLLTFGSLVCSSFISLLDCSPISHFSYKSPRPPPIALHLSSPSHPQSSPQALSLSASGRRRQASPGVRVCIPSPSSAQTSSLHARVVLLATLFPLLPSLSGHHTPTPRSIAFRTQWLPGSSSSFYSPLFTSR